MEGEVRRYFEHAITLRDSIRVLRTLPRSGMQPNAEAGESHSLVDGQHLLGLNRHFHYSSSERYTFTFFYAFLH